MSLNEEMVLPLTNKNLLPKNTLDRGLFVLMTTGIPMMFVWELFVLSQYRTEFDLACAAHLFFQIFFLVNMLGNMYFLQRVDSSAKRKDLPSVLKPNWKYCHFCQINAPPRSYHCPICEECILRRDQHCMFAGCCVGFYNHRYYIMAVFYTMIGVLYYFIFQGPHCFENIGGFQLNTIPCIVAPHIAVLFGFLSIYGFVCTVSQIVLATVFTLTAYLLGVQVVCITAGQTIHEKRAGIALYDLSWKRNVKQVLGKRWLWALVNPFASSPLEGDGIHFQTFYDLFEIKNV